MRDRHQGVAGQGRQIIVRESELYADVGKKQITVSVHTRHEYEIVLEKTYDAGVVPSIVAPIVSGWRSDRIVIVTDSNVRDIFARQLELDVKECASRVELVTIPAGERSKSVDQAIDTWARFKELGI